MTTLILVAIQFILHAELYQSFILILLHKLNLTAAYFRTVFLSFHFDGDNFVVYLQSDIFSSRVCKLLVQTPFYVAFCNLGGLLCR